MKRNLSFLITFIFISFINAQQEPFHLVDARIYGTASGGAISRTVKDDVGNIFTLSPIVDFQAGEGGVDSYGSVDVMLTKFDIDKNILWQKSYGGDGMEITELSEVYILPDGNLVIIIDSNSGVSGNRTAPNNSPNNDRDIWIVKVDGEDGSILQQRSISG